MSEDQNNSHENPFENPFRKLNKKLFPKKDNKGTNQAVSGKKKKADPADDNPAIFKEAMSPEEQADHADSMTFLRAMIGIKKLGEGHQKEKLHQKAQKTSELNNKLDNKVFSNNEKIKLTNLNKKSVSPETHSASAPEKKVQTSVSDSDNNAPSPDVDLFATAMQDVTPLEGRGRSVPQEVSPATMPQTAERHPLQDFIEGKIEFSLASTNEYVEGHVLGLDLLTVGKLQAGQYSPESHLDLHGLNTIQAFDALVGFVKGAYFKGHRTLLLVSGRGLNSPQGLPVLRMKVQQWLTQDPFRRVVLAFCTARPADGGAGAIYILLRKHRKDVGKICWDRKPTDPDLL